MSELATRPTSSVVGVSMQHESRRPARHRPGAVHRRPGQPARRRAARLPGAGHAHPRARHVAAHRARAYEVPGVVRVLTAADVPGVNDAGVKHDEPLFPSEVLLPRARGVLGARRDPGGRADRRGQGRGRVRAAAVAGDGAPRPSRRRASRARGPPCAAASRKPQWDACAHVFEGEFEFGGQEHFYLETHAALALRRRERAGVRPVQHAAPQRDPGDRRARAGPRQPRGHRAVPADGRRVRRQGDAAARLRRDRRARRQADRPPGAGAAQPHAGHDDDRQAAPLPRARGRSGSTATAAPRAGRHAHLRRRLEPRPLRAGLARALFHFDNAY